MSEQPHYSRRSFLTGVLATGALSAAGTYYTNGGQGPDPQDPPVKLRLGTGPDATGARQLLIDLWNRANPRVQVEARSTTPGSEGDRRELLRQARNNEVDILNLDIIDIPEFATTEKVITPVRLDSGPHFLQPLEELHRVPDSPDHYYAVPLNTDVGMLFSRSPADTPTSPADAPESPTDLKELLTSVAEGSGAFVAQLKRGAISNLEAFSVNVLEHVLSVNPALLREDRTHLPSLNQEAWREALKPLKAAVDAGKFTRTESENASLAEFIGNSRTYMRNWPVNYRQLLERGVAAAGIRVHRLSTGILGGQSLAVVAGTPHAAQAAEFIRFMSDVPAQKVLAERGFAPTRNIVYENEDLKAVIPHLAEIRTAVESARIRPIHPRYREFSQLIWEYVGALLDGSQAVLDQEFFDRMEEIFLD